MSLIFDCYCHCIISVGRVLAEVVAFGFQMFRSFYESRRMRLEFWLSELLSSSMLLRGDCYHVVSTLVLFQAMIRFLKDPLIHLFTFLDGLNYGPNLQSLEFLGYDPDF